MSHTQEVLLQQPKTKHVNMKDILALVTRLVVALELMAQNSSGGNTSTKAPAKAEKAKVEVEPEAEEEEVTKPAKGKTKVEKAKVEKVDYSMLRETGHARIKELAAKGVSVDAMKKLVTKHGAPKFSEMADEKLQVFLVDLEALASLEADV